MKPGIAGHVDSYYCDTAGRPRYRPPVEGALSAEVCVVGGGLAGLTTALELARHGVETVLVEARRIGWSASGRNGGFVSPGFAESIFAIEERLGLDHARALHALSLEGVGFVRNTIAQAGRDDIIGGHGWLKLIRHGQTGLLEHRAERMIRDYGATIEFLPRRALAAHVTSERYHGGLLDTAPFHIQPLDYCFLLADLAEAAGARLAENSRAGKVSRRNGGWRVQLSGGGSVDAGQVVVATSAHNGPLARVNAALVPVATYVVAAENGEAGFGSAIRFSGCIGDTRRASDYYRLVEDGGRARLVWGGRITTRKHQPADLAERIRRDIEAVYPQLTELTISHAWQGLMGYARHKMPLIAQPAEGVWVATAFGGHGLNTTAMAGRLVAAAIADGDDRYRLFEPFGLSYAGGWAGRLAVQFEYWRLQWLDRIEESRAALTSESRTN